jgi:hypothetical protein
MTTSSKTKGVHELLSEIQNELKSPKGQTNEFGGFKYRSAEDILEAVKPLVGKRKMSVTITDDLELIGDRYYVRATVSINNGSESVETTAYARETEHKKGMDSAQVTGATSSYARKYALNGMFAIDDTKDADSFDNTKPATPVRKAGKSTTKVATKAVTPAKVTAAAPTTPTNDIMGKAIEYIKSQTDKGKAYDLILRKYGEQLTDPQKKGISKFL